VLARIIFFAFEGSSHAAFKIAWCTMMLVVQTIYMVRSCAGRGRSAVRVG
jgi:hypothetical protein